MECVGFRMFQLTFFQGEKKSSNQHNLKIQGVFPLHVPKFCFPAFPPDCVDWIYHIYDPKQISPLGFMSRFPLLYNYVFHVNVKPKEVFKNLFILIFISSFHTISFKTWSDFSQSWKVGRIFVSTSPRPDRRGTWEPHGVVSIRKRWTACRWLFLLLYYHCFCSMSNPKMHPHHVSQILSIIPGAHFPPQPVLLWPELSAPCP